MSPQEVLKLALRTSEAVDRVFDALPGWKPEEMLVIFIMCARAIAEHYPEHRPLAISQFSLAVQKLAEQKET